MTGNSPFFNDTPRLFAFVCDQESRILSSAAMKGTCFALTEGYRLLEAVTATDNRNVTHLWQELVTSGFSMHTEVDVALVSGSLPQPMLFHAMLLHFGQDEGKFLVTLCSGFRPVSSGPDEVARSRAVLNTAVDTIITIDNQCRICSVNPATERMFGFEARELAWQQHQFADAGTIPQ